LNLWEKYLKIAHTLIRERYLVPSAQTSLNFLKWSKTLWRFWKWHDVSFPGKLWAIVWVFFS